MDSSYSPKADWTIFDEVLNEKHIPRQVMIYPERYRDQYNATRRIAAIRLMYKRGMSKGSISAQTPFTSQYIGRILANGSQSLDQNLPYEDNVLSLRDEKEAVTESNPLETDGA